MEECIFCKIVKKDIDANIVFEDDLVAVFPSIDPIAEKHFLVIPKKHISSFIDISESDNQIFIAMKNAVQKLISDNTLESGYKVGFNGGKYLQVKHLHWHVLGGKFYHENDILNKT